MKLKKILYSAMTLLTLAGVSSCQNSFDDPVIEAPVAKMVANTTIAEFKDQFAAEGMQICPYKDEETKTPYIIKGRVVSSDATGNIYMALYIQDETSALTFAVKCNDLYNTYHLGQEIVVNLTGLWIGKYKNLFQVGWLGVDSSGEDSMGRVNFEIFKPHVELNGFPTSNVDYITPEEQKPANSMYCIIESIDQLPTSPGEDFYNLQGQLVEFRNVTFEDGGKEIFSPFQDNANRYITQEGNSLRLCVRNSGYSTFYNKILPEGTGTLRGILSYYASDPSYQPKDGSINGWQLLLRSLDDVMFDQKGQQDDPYTIAEAAELQDQSIHGWVKGFIVGSVKADVSTVTKADDIVFGSEAEMDNNLVIAANENETDWTKCMAVALPQGSALREFGNLADHPQLYKKSIAVSGDLKKYLGMPGVQGTGASNTFEIDGVELGGDPVVNGDGTKEKPYNVSQVKSSTEDRSAVWVEGYVVGYVPDKAWDDAVYGNTPTPSSENYTGGKNFILSSVPPTSANASNSLPVAVPVGDLRSVLGMALNPSIYGAKVKIKGEITNYYGIRGVKSVSEYEIIEAGEGGEVTPPTPPEPTPGETASGSGTEADPYNVAYVSTSTLDVSGVWVEGYVAGYVPDKAWDGAVFGNEATPDSENYTGGKNFVMSSVPAAEASASNSIPVAIPIGDLRAQLGIALNPSIYGKKVMVKGDITKYYGIRGVKNITEYKLVE